MRRSNFAALAALAVLAVLAAFSRADALQSVRASKDVVITIVVTPSPAPMGFLPRRSPRAAQPPATGVAFAALLADPYAGPRQIASAAQSAWDVPPGAGRMVAQVEASPVPVQFVAKADPNAKYLKVTLNTPELDAPYGTSVYPCVFQIYTWYDLATYALNDYGYGTSKTGTGTFPIENYPTTSYLSWSVPDFSPTYTAYWNSGSPGEKVWTRTRQPGAAALLRSDARRAERPRAGDVHRDDPIQLAGELVRRPTPGGQSSRRTAARTSAISANSTTTP